MYIDVTGKLTEWFYMYMAYSVKSKAAYIYMNFRGEEDNTVAR